MVGPYMSNYFIEEEVPSEIREYPAFNYLQNYLLKKLDSENLAN